MKSFLCMGLILVSSISALAEGEIAVRCKDSSGNAETVIVKSARIKEGILKLYSLDSSGKIVEFKSYDSSYSCLIEGVILKQTL